MKNNKRSNISLDYHLNSEKLYPVLYFLRRPSPGVDIFGVDSISYSIFNREKLYPVLYFLRRRPSPGVDLSGVDGGRKEPTGTEHPLEQEGGDGSLFRITSQLLFSIYKIQCTRSLYVLSTFICAF